jgi:hypothetical protein
MQDHMAKTGISSEAVQAKTGKGWEEWAAVLDKEKADKLPHKAIAELLNQKYELSNWWSQMVTVGYERMRGLRQVHETKQGFVASISRTINLSRPELWELLQEPVRMKWLTVPHKVASHNTPKTLRLNMPDGSRVEFGIIDKGKKSSITAQHSYLKDAKEVAEKKELWAKLLGALKALAEED